MNNGKILFCLKSNTCFIKLIGELRYTLSSGFESLVRRELENEQITHFVLDTKETEYMDSTNLGILGMIAAGLKKKSSQKPVIVSPQQDILTILKSMGFDSLFEIAEGRKTEQMDFQDCSTIETKKLQPNELVLESHKTLAEMNKYNKEKFTPVIDAILKKKK